MRNTTNWSVRQYALWLAFSVLLTLGLSVSAYAVPAAPGLHDFTQADGEVVQVQTRGDEFLDWLEDEDGNLLVVNGRNLDYAVWTDAGPESNGHKATKNKTKKHPGDKGRNIAPGQLKKAREERQRTQGITNSLM